MKAIILAAGVGTRLGNLAKNRPKCLLELNNSPILEKQISILARSGIEDVYVVVGVEGDCWTKENHRKIKSISKNVIFNESNISKNRVYSLFKGIKGIDDGPVLIIDGDIFFEKVVIDKILESDKENVMLAKGISKDSEERKIVLGDDGNIIGFGVKEPVNDRAYSYGGIMKVGKNLFKDIKNKVSETKNHNNNISIIIDLLYKSHNISIITVNGRWINLNTENDLKDARRLVVKKDAAVIWDLDGVIFDSEPLQLIAYKEAFLNQGIEIQGKDYLKNAGRKDMFQRICKKYSAKCDFSKWYKDKNSVYWKEINKGIKVLPGVDRLLIELNTSRYKIALVSSTSRRNILFILNKLHIRDYFEEIVGFEDTKEGKPDPEPYLKITEKLGIEPRKCIAIEDTGFGVESAKRAGMKCVAVTQTNRIKQNHKEADLVVESLGDFNIEKLEAI